MTNRPFPSLLVLFASERTRRQMRARFSAAPSFLPVYPSHSTFYVETDVYRPSPFHRNASSPSPSSTSLFSPPFSLSLFLLRTLPVTASFLFVPRSPRPDLTPNSGGFTHRAALGTLIRATPRSTDSPCLSFKSVPLCTRLLDKERRAENAEAHATELREIDPNEPLSVSPAQRQYIFHTTRARIKSNSKLRVRVFNVQPEAMIFGDAERITVNAQCSMLNEIIFIDKATLP